MLVSIILVTHNSLDYLKDCLAHLKKYTNCPYELIIIDNASKDGSVAWLKNYRKTVKNNKWMKRLNIIFNKKNKFFTRAVNQGIFEAKGNYYAILNADVVVTENWLKNILKYFEILPDAAAIGPIIGGTRIASHLLFDQSYEDNFGKLQFQYPPDKDLQEFARDFQKQYSGDYIEAKVLCFACAVLKRSVVEKIGGLDKNFLLRGDDWEWCLRARVAGYGAYIAADTFILHYSRGSIDTLPSTKESELNKHDGDHWLNILYSYHNPATLPQDRILIKDIWNAPFLDVSHLNPQITKLLTFEDLFTNKFPFYYSGRCRRSEHGTNR